MTDNLKKIKKIIRSPGLAAVWRWSKSVHWKVVVICLITVITSLRKEDGTAVYYKEELLVIAAAAAIIGCTYIFGMLPTLALFVILWLKLVEKASWKTVVIIPLIVMAIVIGVFVLWLGVRFPNGLIYNAIVNR